MITCWNFPSANQETALKQQLSIRVRFAWQCQIHHISNSGQTNTHTYTCARAHTHTHTEAKSMCFPGISSKWHTSASLLNHDLVLRCQSAHHFAIEIIPGITDLSSSKTTEVCIRERGKHFLRVQCGQALQQHTLCHVVRWLVEILLVFSPKGKSYISKSTHAERMYSKTKDNSKFSFECLLFFLCLLLMFIPISMAKQNHFSFLR